MCCICSGPLCVYVSLCVAVSLLAPVRGSVCASMCSSRRVASPENHMSLTYTPTCVPQTLYLDTESVHRSQPHPVVLGVPLCLSCGWCISLSAWSCRRHLAALLNPCPGKTRPGASPISGLNQELGELG